MNVGFTGTQAGMTAAQRASVAPLLVTLQCSTLHHGDCVGADAEAHDEAHGVPIRVEIHPPRNSDRRAFCPTHPWETVREVLPHLERNRSIVDSVEILVAAPKEESGECLRSGTWSTVRYARKRGIPVYVIRPDGIVVPG